MNNLQKMLSAFGCCSTADDETVECDPTGRCHCRKILDVIQSWVINLENRINRAENDVKKCPQYAEAINQSGNREIISTNDPSTVQPIYAPMDCFYADMINELFYRAWTVTSKLHRNSEIVQHCLAYALTTWQHVFSKEPNLIPGVSPPAGKTIRCRCRCMPIVNILQKYVLNLLKKMDCNDQDLMMCLDHTKATYSPNSNAQAERQEEQAISALPIKEPSEIKKDQENLVLKSSSFEEEHISKCYPMDCQFRGRCIFFGHGIFDNKYLSQRLNIIDEEKARIEKTFTNLGFQTESHLDLKYCKIKRIIDKLTRQDFTNDDCICIFISTHGESGGLLWAKDVCYSFVEIFEDRIASIKSLINKPKIFFIQACRGPQVDQGIYINDVDTSSEDEVDGDEKFTKVSVKADFFKAYSSPPGFLSWRGWFIREICKSFDKYRKTADLETIVKIASREVRKLESKCDFSIEKDKAKQVPYVEHTLDKMVFFSDKKSPAVLKQ